ncbi:MAG: AraC family transcriptional regulator [Lachnospiraceae bacterium]|nr:AraC family transcriptional regulator [Lachnospiraceae bacterium]
MEDAYVLQLSGHKFRDLYLCFCGYAKCGSLHGFGPAVRPNYILHYILEGKGRYRAGDRQYELHEGQGFLIEPEVQTFYQADQEDPWTYLWVGFGGEYAGEYLEELGLNSRQLVFQCQYGQELKQIIIEMLKSSTCSSTHQFRLQGLLYSFFSVLARDIHMVPSSGSQGDNLYIRRAMEFIHNNYFNNIRVTDIARYVCIDRSYLYTLFRRILDQSPQDYLTTYRLTRAAELLTVTDLPVAGVALSCGYQDPLVFGKAFKAKNGLTPSQYRKKNRQDARERLERERDLLEKL